MQEWLGLLLMMPDRIGMVKVGFDYAGLVRTVVYKAG